MKILFINGTNKIGGGELSLLSIAKHFRGSCSVVSSDEGDFTKLLLKNGIDSIILKSAKELLSIKREDGIKGILLNLKSFILTLFELRKLMKKYNIIYCNSQKGILIGLLASLFMNKKIVIHVRDILNNPNISFFQRKIFSLLVNLRNPVIIANSYATKDALVDIGVKKNIEVIYNGISIPKLPTTKKKKNKFIVAMFSRISHWKGQEYFIEAINLLKEKEEFSKMEFWIVGDALMTDKDKEYKRKIVKLINNYNLEDKIKMFGFVDEPMNLMKDIDVLVLPSIYPEPFGRVVVEAMLLKKVVIATDHGGVTEIIENHHSGILVDANIDKLAYHISRYILELYNNKDFYRFLSENGYKKAIMNFTEDKMIEKIRNLIRSL